MITNSNTQMHRKTTFIGTVGQQKYEAEACIKKHLKIIHETPSSKETSRWREDIQANSNSNNPNMKKENGEYLKTQELNSDNKAMADRLFFILSENREKKTKEYAPGWRIGNKGRCQHRAD